MRVAIQFSRRITLGLWSEVLTRVLDASATWCSPGIDSLWYPPMIREGAIRNRQVYCSAISWNGTIDAIRSGKCDGVVATGGETARCIIDALPALSIRVCHEVHARRALGSRSYHQRRAADDCQGRRLWSR